MGMIPTQSSSFGKEIGIYTRYKILEDGTKNVKVGTTIYAGNPVTLSAASDTYQGQLVPVTTNIAVYGLAKFQYNSYMNEVTDGFGMYGSGKGTVVVKGIVEVYPNVFTLTDGTEVTVNTYTTNLTYAPMQKLYIDVTNSATLGMITNDTTNNANTFIGYCLIPPSTMDAAMQIWLGNF